MINIIIEGDSITIKRDDIVIALNDVGKYNHISEGKSRRFLSDDEADKIMQANRSIVFTIEMLIALITSEADGIHT